MSELVLRARFVPRARTAAPNVDTRTTTSEYDVAIQTSGAGFRTGAASRPLPAGFPKVAVLGDSFIFGSGVAAQDMLTSRLQQHLIAVREPCEVLNFGVPGTGPLNDLYVWRDCARGMQPGIVVAALYAGNDAADALRETKQAHPRLVTVARAELLWERIWSRWRHSKAPAGANTGAATTGGWNAFGLGNPAALDALL
ncbi:MAG TPA: hypothetical protein VFH88_03380, partial [Candidatus Krumholzibacteria bacterium]|nr:hypothetical protein [Candidatus Krumholzibacteria bacterium]